MLHRLTWLGYNPGHMVESEPIVMVVRRFEAYPGREGKDLTGLRKQIFSFMEIFDSI